MNYNYHTHTFRCQHAFGTPEEYIKRAIDCGITHMGFSEHFPLMFSDGTQSYYRLQIEDIPDYFSELTALKEKYQKDIDIKIGFEMEYYPELFDKMIHNARLYGADYLLLGMHFVAPENTENSFYSGNKTESEERLKTYTSLVIEAIEKEVFTYVAHPDLLNFTGNAKLYKDALCSICVAAKLHNTPLEINFLGIRDERNYPSYTFFEAASETQAPVTFGFDAHDVLSAYDGESLQIAESIVQEYCLNYIGKPKLRVL